MCGRLLADLGAEVIKVEPPGGDPGRRLGPFARNVPEAEASLSFSYFNANKKGIVLDLTTPEGRERLKALAKDIDVILETFPAGGHAELGLGPFPAFQGESGAGDGFHNRLRAVRPSQRVQGSKHSMLGYGGRYVPVRVGRPAALGRADEPALSSGVRLRCGWGVAGPATSGVDGSRPGGRSLLPGGAGRSAARVGELQRQRQRAEAGRQSDPRGRRNALRDIPNQRRLLPHCCHCHIPLAELR